MAETRGGTSIKHVRKMNILLCPLVLHMLNSGRSLFTKVADVIHNGFWEWLRQRTDAFNKL